MSESSDLWEVGDGEAGQRLDKWLAFSGRLGSRSKALNALRKGKVFLDGVEQNDGDAVRKVCCGSRVRYWADRPGSSEVRFSTRHTSGLHILYEDSRLIAVNKPAGLLTVPRVSGDRQPCLADKVSEHLKNRGASARVVHRIDRDTSGVVVFAKSPEAQAALKTQFEQRKPERVYVAVVEGDPEPPSGTWTDWIVMKQGTHPYRVETEADRPQAKEAICRYSVRERFTDGSLLEVRLVTGRRNQIRIQAALRGHTVVGEKEYRRPGNPVLIRFARQALHAARLAIRHPVRDSRIEFVAPLPRDMELLLARLRKRPKGPPRRSTR